MRGALHAIGGLLLVCVLVWGAVVIYWQANEVRPSAHDLLLYLAVLPVGAYATLLLLRKGIRSAGERAQKQASDESQPTASPGSAEFAKREVQQQRPLAVLASGLRLAAGSDVDTLAAAAQAAPAPLLHKRLKDGAGFPVFAAGSDEVDEDAAMEWWVASGVNDDVVRSAQPEHLRAISLLQPLLQDLFMQVTEQSLLDAPLQTSTVHRRPPQLPVLKVIVFVPMGWNMPLRQAVSEAVLSEATFSGLPQEQIEVSVDVALAGVDVLARLQQWARQLSPTSTEVATEFRLLAACGSWVGAQSVESLDAAGQLLSAQQPEGLVPGEGAAAVLVAQQGKDGEFPGVPQALLQGLAIERKGVSWKTRTAVQQTADLVKQALQVAGLGREAVVSLLTDADQRGSRRTVSAGITSCELSHLEPDEDCVDLGLCCGYLGQVAPLVLVAAAAQKAVNQAEGGVLALHLSDAQSRAVIVVLPPPNESLATPVPPALASN